MRRSVRLEVRRGGSSLRGAKRWHPISTRPSWFDMPAAASCLTAQLYASCASGFQLLLQLVQKVPVGSLGDQLLRVVLDQSDLEQPQRVEPNRVLRTGFAPAVVR